MTRAHACRSPRPGLVARLALVGVISLLHASRADAQLPWSLEIDNDALNPTAAGPPSDAEYTHGMRLRISHGSASPLGRWLFRSLPGCAAVGGSAPCQDWSLVLGQELYTPEITHLEAASGERAYAGWLGASMQTRVHWMRVEHGVSLTLGTTGGPSLAAPSQKAVHHLIGSPQPVGWNAQLGAEPTLDLAYDGLVEVLVARVGPGLGWRITPVWGATLGTVHREAAVGVEGALELGASGVSRRRRGNRPVSGSGLYLLGALRGRAVAGNLFLDGGFFRSGPSVGHLPFVGSVEFGAGARVHGLGLEWSVVSSSREYATQAWPHVYSTLAVTL